MNDLVKRARAMVDDLKADVWLCTENARLLREQGRLPDAARFESVRDAKAGYANLISALVFDIDHRDQVEIALSKEVDRLTECDIGRDIERDMLRASVAEIHRLQKIETAAEELRAAWSPTAPENAIGNLFSVLR